jgi:soluble lytic murein transglycosylase-like protein
MLVAAMALMALLSPLAHAETAVDLSIIKTIESNGDPTVVNYGSGCYGLYQISEVCLKDYNQQHDSHYRVRDLLKPSVNHRISSWYFGRIREMLASLGIPINLITMIASYNWGIGNVAEWAQGGMRFKELPLETRRYIRKYIELTRNRS